MCKPYISRWMRKSGDGVFWCRTSKRSCHPSMITSCSSSGSPVRSSPSTWVGSPSPLLTLTLLLSSKSRDRRGVPGGVGNQKFLVAAKNQKKNSENQFFGFASWRPAFLHFSLHTSYIAQFVYRNCTRNVHYKKDMIIHVFFVYICVA